MTHRAARLAAALAPAEPTDAELLARFAADRDAGAFELLVWRHAALVLRACRAVLRDHHAAEDAAQAVFLALARQAGTAGRDGTAAGWLFRVARRVSARAARRRVVAPVPGADLEALPAPEPFLPDADTERAVQEEVARLPEQYRVPVLLCFFEGLTHAEAARRLGVPVGTLAGRIARAKDTLAVRLARRGLPLVLAASAGVAPGFAASTARAAVAFATRRGAPGPAFDLAKQELRMTLFRKLTGAALAVAVAGACLGVAVGNGAPPTPPAAPAPRVASEKPAAPKPPAAVIGKTFAVAPITTDLQRRLIRGAGADSTALVVVHASAVFTNAGTLDVGALELGELRKALTRFGSKEKSVVHFVVQYQELPDVSADAAEALDYILAGAARANGLVPGLDRHHYFGGPTFDARVAPLKGEQGVTAAETGAGDERVVAYPVRTPLSRMLTGIETGAVVDVRTPLACRGDAWLPEDVDRSVRAALGKLKRVKGGQVNFLLNVPDRDDKAPERLQRVGRAWAEDAGLELGHLLNAD